MIVADGFSSTFEFHVRLVLATDPRGIGANVSVSQCGFSDQIESQTVLSARLCTKRVGRRVGGIAVVGHRR